MSALQLRIGSDPPTTVKFTRRSDGLRILGSRHVNQTYRFSEYGRGVVGHSLTGTSWAWCYFTVLMSVRSEFLAGAFDAHTPIWVEDSDLQFRIAYLGQRWRRHVARHYVRLEA